MRVSGRIEHNGMVLDFETDDFTYDTPRDVVNTTAEGDEAEHRVLEKRQHVNLQMSFPAGERPLWRKTNTAPDADGEE